MPVPTQAKRVRVLEDSRVRRLGGTKELHVDVRLIAATNKELGEALRNGQLREDLYFRLNVFLISLPPLRERDGDLPQLIETLLPDLNRKHGTRVTGVGLDDLNRFRQYSWPGNVRELRNVLCVTLPTTRRGRRQCSGSAKRQCSIFSSNTRSTRSKASLQSMVGSLCLWAAFDAAELVRGVRAMPRS